MKKKYEVALLLLFGCLVAAFAFNLPNESAEWAAWVQAFGSIAAIIGAVGIAAHQAKENRKQLDALEDAAATQRTVQLTAIRGLLEELQNALRGTSVTLQTSGAASVKPLVAYASIRLRPVQTAFFALQKIPFHEVPQIYIGTEGLNLAIYFENVLRNLEQLSRLDVTETDAAIRANEYINNVNTYTARSAETLEQIGAIVEKYDGKKSPRLYSFDI